MTKKKLSQNEDEKDENPVESSTNQASIQNFDISKRKLINKARYAYIFSTPIKKERSHPFIPITPKKKKKDQEYVGLPIIGKNLLTIFDSM